MVENNEPIVAPSATPPVAETATKEPAPTNAFTIPESMPAEAAAIAKEEAKEEKEAKKEAENKQAPKASPEASPEEETENTKNSETTKPAEKTPAKKPAEQKPAPPAEGSLDTPPNPQQAKPSKSEHLKNASIKVPDSASEKRWFQNRFFKRWSKPDYRLDDLRRSFKLCAPVFIFQKHLCLLNLTGDLFFVTKHSFTYYFVRKCKIV